MDSSGHGVYSYKGSILGHRVGHNIEKASNSIGKVSGSIDGVVVGLRGDHF
jgi:hypothetical protein